jgi:hypothetical protein
LSISFLDYQLKEMVPTQTKYLFYSTLIFFSFLTSCKREEPEKARVPVNSFSMLVNGEKWMPFQDKHDPCTSTYTSGYGHYGEKPMYTFYAYRDPAGTTDAYSENLLRMRVMNVTQPGTYLLDGTYKEDFDSYIMFQIQRPQGNVSRYVNDPDKSPFTVTVDEITFLEWATIPGAKGSFSGIIYNEADPSDSLTIEKGKFAFDIMGGDFKHHCGFK